jgi:hypothetical protein
MCVRLPRIETEHVRGKYAGYQWMAHYEPHNNREYGWGDTEAEAVLDLIDECPRGIQCTKDAPFLSAVTWEAARTR